MGRHARIPPTREIFAVPTDGTEATQKGDHTGYLIDSQGEVAGVELYVPWDYKELVDLVVVLIPVTKASDASTMNFSVECQFAKKNQIYNSNDVTDALGDPIQFGFTGAIDLIREIDISNMVRGSGFAVRDIEAGDYIGFDVQSNANNGDDLNALILGIRLRYKVFRGK